MLPEIKNAISALDGFAKAVSEHWTDQPYHQAIGGWNIPPLSRQDLAERATSLSERLKLVPDDQVTTQLRLKMAKFPDQISYFQSQTLPQITGGNAPQVIANFEIIMSNIEASIAYIEPNWQVIPDLNRVPRELAKKIRSLEAALSALEPRAGNIEEKINRINEAHDAATDLPVDMQTLRESNESISATARDVSRILEELNSQRADTTQHLDFIRERRGEAEKLISNIDSAYSAATTAGLAGAFRERANQLSRSTWIWVGFLFAALVAGGLIGYHRLSSLQALLSDDDIDAQWIWLNAAMSFFSLAAPVWFAWVATRQIGQRFRLAEDYGFKASVARAYEGYRREAARLDPELEARLFAAALDRLEEAPLRFLATRDHDSPYEALLASAGFQKALERLPDLRATLSDALDRVAPRQATPPAVAVVDDQPR